MFQQSHARWGLFLLSKSPAHSDAPPVLASCCLQKRQLSWWIIQVGMEWPSHHIPLHTWQGIHSHGIIDCHHCNAWCLFLKVYGTSWKELEFLSNLILLRATGAVAECPVLFVIPYQSLVCVLEWATTSSTQSHPAVSSWSRRREMMWLIGPNWMTWPFFVWNKKNTYILTQWSKLLRVKIKWSSISAFCFAQLHSFSR